MTFQKIIAVGLANKTIRVFWSADGQQWTHADCTGHAGKIQGVEVIPGGHVVSWSRRKKDGGAIAWSLDAGGSWSKWALSGPTAAITGCAVLPSGEVATCSKDRVVYTYWPKSKQAGGGWTGQELDTTPGTPGSIAALAGGGLAVQLDAGVMTWRNRGSPGDWVFRGGPKWDEADNELFQRVWPSPRPRNFLALMGTRGKLYEWAETEAGWDRVLVLGTGVDHCKVAGEKAVVAKLTKVGLLDVAAREVLVTGAWDWTVEAVDVLPDGHVIVAGSGGFLKVWDPTTVRLVREEARARHWYLPGRQFTTFKGGRTREYGTFATLDGLTRKSFVDVRAMAADAFAAISRDKTLRYFTRQGGEWSLAKAWDLPKKPVSLGARAFA